MFGQRTEDDKVWNVVGVGLIKYGCIMAPSQH